MSRIQVYYPKLLNWITLGWLDIKSRYRRTVLGPFWIVLNTLVSIGFLGLVYKTIFNIPLRDFLPYIAAGIILWNLIFSNTTESCYAFISQKFLLQGIPIGPELILIRLVCRNTVIFLHNLLLLIIILLVLQQGLSWSAILAIPGLILIFLISISFGIILAYSSVRFRDLPQIVSSLLSIFFLATPIIWPQRLLGENQLLAVLNPLTHIISVVRNPLLGTTPSLISWIVVWLIFLLSGILAIVINRRYNHRILYWL